MANHTQMGTHDPTHLLETDVQRNLCTGDGEDMPGESISQLTAEEKNPKREKKPQPTSILHSPCVAHLRNHH